MIASASVPVIMEPTIIDGQVGYDGGVRDLLPFTRAINQGAETIVPITNTATCLDRISAW
ncbi:hypothetical protein ES707_12238 [subsurface metagenome]